MLFLLGLGALAAPTGATLSLTVATPFGPRPELLTTALCTGDVFQVTVVPERSGSAVLVGVGPTGRTRMLYPGPGEAATAWAGVPLALPPLVLVPPTGTETLMLFVTAESSPPTSEQVASLRPGATRLVDLVFRSADYRDAVPAATVTAQSDADLLVMWTLEHVGCLSAGR